MEKMETNNKITCPACGHHFNAEQALSQHIEDKLKSEFNQKYKSLKAKLDKETEEKEQELKKQLSAERQKLQEEVQKKIKEDFELQLKSMSDDLENKKKENRELKNKELELLKKEKELKEKKEEMEMDLKKQLLERSVEIEEAARKKAEEESQMKMKEKDMQLQSMKDQIEIMKRKADQGSMQLQGEAQELVLEELLKTTFPFDLIEEVGKGVKGADVIHTVRNNFGKECGRIVYESKRTKAFSDSWIDKIKNDLRGQNADLAVIVTETMPKELDRFGVREGVWVCTFQEIKSVAMILRDSLMKIHAVRVSQENKGDKMQMLYDYLTGREFRQQMEAIVEGFTSMQEGLMKEKNVTQKLWKEREKQIEKVIQNTIDMYGSVRGIAGNAVGEIKQLESPDMLEEKE
ncbi:MAG: DUF2130 domain-containing protein [Cytophagaceae bacterium]